MNHVVHLRDDGCKGSQDLQSFVMVLDEDLEVGHLLITGEKAMRTISSKML